MNSASNVHDRVQRKRLQYQLHQISARILEVVQAVVAFGGLAVVLLLQVPWLDGPLKKLGFNDTSALSQTVVVAVLVALYMEIRSANQRTKDANRTHRHLADPMDVYPILLDRARSIIRKEEKVLDVIGMTLYTAWPSIRFWLNRPEMAGWKVRFAAVVDATDMSRLVPPEWFEESRSNLDQIAELAEVKAVKERGIHLEAYGYDFVPVLHGYRLGNGDLFYSVLMWDSDGRIGREVYSYEYIECTNHSPSAQAAREVFDSWFKRACRKPWTA